MRNIVKKMTINYSPNFDLKKRTNSKIKYLIFHYTGMKSDKSAIKRLTDFNSKVSCHYFIDLKGSIIQMVPDTYVAWHAGKSSWGSDKNLNKNSIGIEISNSGHEHGYKNFKNIQIKNLIKLSKKLIIKYSIKSKNILGHSDIAPLRKKDPGEKFPWQLLYKNKIGIWYGNKSKFKNQFKKSISNKLEKEFFNNLKKFGYAVKFKTNSDKKKIIKSFQRRFRPNLVNGTIDLQTYSILKSLI